MTENSKEAGRQPRPGPEALHPEAIQPEAIQPEALHQRLILEAAKDYAIFTTDLDRQITTWNAGAQALFGYSAPDILGQLADTLFTPQDRQQGIPQQEAAKAQTQGRTENARWHLHQNGSWLYGSGVTSPLFDSTGALKGLVTVVQDRTAQKRAEEALRQAEQRWRLAIEAARMATWEWDLVTNQVVWNEQHFRLLGMAVQPNPLPAEAFMRHLHPADADSIKAQLTQAITQRTLYEAEFRVVRDDGVTRWMSGYGHVTQEEDGQPIRASGIMVDITERRATQEALRQSEEQFRLLIQASSDSVYKMNADWTQMQQLLGKSFLADTAEPSVSWLQTYIPDEDQEPVQQVIQAAIGTKSPFELEHRVRRADGSIGWTFSRAIPVLDEQGAIWEWLGAASDITARKQAEQALRDSEARLQLALGAAQLGTFVWHLTEDRTEADAQALAHFGLPPDTQATLADSLARIFHPDDGPRYVAAIAQAADPAGSGTLHQEFRIRRADGERWMSVSATTVFEGSPPVVSQIIGVLADITQRKQAATSLYHSEARLRTILDSAKDYAIFTADLAGHVTAWNRGAQTLFGYSEQDILQQSVVVLYNPQDRQEGVPRLEAETAIREGRFDNERWHSRADGSLFYGSGVVTPLHDESGRVIGLLKVMRDLTTQKRAEQALRQSEQRLQQAISIPNVGVVFFDEAGIFTSANDAFLRLTGFSRAALEQGALSTAHLILPEWQAVSQQAHQALIATGRSIPYQKQLQRPDGSRWWGLFASSRVSESEYVKFVLDITDYKRVQERLQQADRRKDEFWPCWLTSCAIRWPPSARACKSWPCRGVRRR